MTNMDSEKAQSDPSGIRAACLECGFSSPGMTVTECPYCDRYTIPLYTNPAGWCRECTMHKKYLSIGQQYQLALDGVLYTFDVTAANANIGERRWPAHLYRLEQVPDGDLRRLLQTNITEPRHYSHIPDTSLPGILAEVALGPKRTLLALIDGSHRAAIAIQQKRTFSAYRLSSALAETILHCTKFP